MSSANDSGATMQPESKRSLSAAPMVNYKNPRTIGQIQDELRAEDSEET